MPHMPHAPVTDRCVAVSSRQREALSPATKLQLALDIAAGMTHLHAENILHCVRRWFTL
jgi:hypothetical protein